MLHIRKFLNLLIFFIALSVAVYVPAQESIIDLSDDDVLPIAPMRYDDVVEPPKNVFSSHDGKDKWERFENGELDAKAYVELQQEYNSIVAGKPAVKRKIASERAKMLKHEQEINKANLIKKDTKKRTLATDAAKSQELNTKGNQTRTPQSQVRKRKNQSSTSLNQNRSPQSKKKIPAAQPLPQKLPAKKK